MIELPNLPIFSPDQTFLLLLSSVFKIVPLTGYCLVVLYETLCDVCDGTVEMSRPVYYQ